MNKQSLIDINKNKTQDYTKIKTIKKNVAGDIKKTDIRFTQPETFTLLKELTKINWKEAYDPTPKSGKSDTLDKNWNIKSNIFLNPPFSKARFFIKKLAEELIKFSSIKRAMVILPWYFVEDIKERVTSGAQWYKTFKRQMKKQKYFIKEYHLKNQPFYDPFKKETTMVRVYGIYISKLI